VSAISTHVLDIAAGCPAAGMRVRLERVARAGEQDIAGEQEIAGAEELAGAEQLAAATTDADGRIARLGPEVVEPGTYRLIFDTGGYLARQREGGDSDGRSHSVAGSSSGTESAAFFPEVTVTFAVADGDVHYHVPLLMSPFGYSTYRGS
jgi:5-hydroxyisourate hydrolase